MNAQHTVTLEDLKRAYRNLAMKHHPDRGGDVETMKEVNALYDEFFDRLKDVHRNRDGVQYEADGNNIQPKKKRLTA